MNNSATEKDIPKFFDETNLNLALGVIIGFSLTAVGFLFWLLYGFGGTEADYPWVGTLPYLNSSFNTISTILILFGLREIKRKNYKKHMNFMIAAFISSSLFLLSYIVYHTLHGDTPFTAEGFIRYIYFTILISHIILSVFVLPLILTTFFFSLSGKLSRHRRIAKITYPVWLYVSVTGVLIFLMLKIFN